MADLEITISRKCFYRGISNNLIKSSNSTFKADQSRKNNFQVIFSEHANLDNHTFLANQYF